MKINEVSKKFNISIDTLRYYEKIDLIEPIKRENGIRNYQQEDLDHIDFIICMKEAGLTLEAIKHYFDLYREGEKTLEQREEILTKQQAIILEKMKKQQKTLDYLDYKINLTKNRISQRDCHKMGVNL